jgi:hypothetical protein
MKPIYICLTLASLISAVEVHAAPLTLRAAKAPVTPNAWDEPAQLSYTKNANGTESYAVNAALSVPTPNIPGTTAQGLVGFWVAKNTLLEKAQDKIGIDASIGLAVGSDKKAEGAFLQATVTGEYDELKSTRGSTLLLAADFVALERLRLGGCGKAGTKSCTYWNLQAGVYSNRAYNASKSIDGRSAGTQVNVKVTSNPFDESSSFHRLGISVSAQYQNDFDSSGTRKKDHRSLFRAKLTWRLYKEEDFAKPSISLERVTGADLLAGLEKQAYTRVAFGLQF